MYYTCGRFESNSVTLISIIHLSPGVCPSHQCPIVSGGAEYFNLLSPHYSHSRHSVVHSPDLLEVVVFYDSVVYIYIFPFLIQYCNMLF